MFLSVYFNFFKCVLIQSTVQLRHLKLFNTSTKRFYNQLLCFLSFYFNVQNLLSLTYCNVCLLIKTTFVQPSETISAPSPPLFFIALAPSSAPPWVFVDTSFRGLSGRIYKTHAIVSNPAHINGIPKQREGIPRKTRKLQRSGTLEKIYMLVCKLTKFSFCKFNKEPVNFRFCLYWAETEQG